MTLEPIPTTCVQCIFYLAKIHVPLRLSESTVLIYSLIDKRNRAFLYLLKHFRLDEHIDIK